MYKVFDYIKNVILINTYLDVFYHELIFNVNEIITGNEQYSIYDHQFILEKTNYESPRRKQRGIMMDHHSLLRRKRRGIGHEEITNTDAFTLDMVLL